MDFGYPQVTDAKLLEKQVLRPNKDVILTSRHSSLLEVWHKTAIKGSKPQCPQLLVLDILFVVVLELPIGRTNYLSIGSNDLTPW